MLTLHALCRSAQRGISLSSIEKVIAYGTTIKKRGATHYLIGRRQVEYNARQGIDLKELEGYRVVCKHDGLILTTYRQRQPSHRRPRQSTTTRAKTTFKVGSDALQKILFEEPTIE